MKKSIFVSLGIFLLSGCAMGINHNTTSINGKPYLVETKTYGFLFEEWSKPSALIPLEEEKEVVMPENYNPSTARAELARMADECNIRSIKAQSRPNYKKMYKCIVDKLAELEQKAD